jgi:hypothetical protein
MKFITISLLSSLTALLMTCFINNQNDNLDDFSLVCELRADSVYESVDNYFSGRLSNNTLQRVWMDTYNDCVEKQHEKTISK